MATLTINVDDDVKADADKLFHSLGLTFTTAINAFLRKSLQEGGIPFMLKANYRGIWVDPTTAYHPKYAADGSAILPADWDDEEDAVYDNLLA